MRSRLWLNRQSDKTAQPLSYSSQGCSSMRLAPSADLGDLAWSSAATNAPAGPRADLQRRGGTRSTRAGSQLASRATHPACLQQTAMISLRVEVVTLLRSWAQLFANELKQLQARQDQLLKCFRIESRCREDGRIDRLLSCVGDLPKADRYKVP
eukprot:471003-Pleurochrysis_carterae.AAC.2